MGNRKLLDARLFVLDLVTVPLAGCGGDGDDADPVSQPRGLGPVLFDYEVVDDRPRAAKTQFEVGVDKVWAFALANGIEPDARIDANWSHNGGWLYTAELPPLESGEPDLQVFAFLSMRAVGGFIAGRFDVRFQENGHTLTQAFLMVGDGDGFGKIVFAENYDAGGEGLGRASPDPFSGGIEAVYAIFRFVGFEPTDVLRATWTRSGAEPFSSEYEMQDLMSSGETDVGWVALTLSNPDGLGPEGYGLTLDAVDETMTGTFEIV